MTWRNNMAARLFGGGLASIGALYLMLAVQLPFQGAGGPGAGFFPVIIAVALMLTGALAGLRPNHAAAISPLSGATAKKLVLIFVSLVAFCLLLPRAGYIPSAIVVTASVLRQLEASWMMTLVVSIIATLATYVLFVMLLRLPLPQGSWFAA